MNPAADTLDHFLQQIARSAPEPWYPRLHAEATGVARDSLDLPLEKLRLGGLIELTVWVQGRGQGYRLTPAGERVLGSPGELARLRAGTLPAARDGQAGPERARPEGPTTFDRGEEVREALVGPLNPLITRSLILANLMVFAYGLVLASREQVPLNEFVYASTTRILMQTGAVSPGALLAGEWWRLLTCCFVHIGLGHLFVNMLSLFLVGRLVEKMWGHGRYLAIYLIAGLGGSCIAMIVKPAVMHGSVPQPVVLAGASGALWGVTGALIVWLVLSRQFLSPSGYSAWMQQLLLVVVMNVYISMQPGISALGHFGGGAVGVAAAVLLHFHRYRTGVVRALTLAGTALLPLLSLGALAHAMNTTAVWKALAQRYRPQPPAGVGQPGPNGREARAEAEWREFQARMASPGQDATLAALRASSQAAGLLEKRPDDRPEEEVRAAREALGAARTGLDRVIGPLAEAQPSQAPAVEKARLLLLEYLKARSEFCALAATYLKEGRTLEGEDGETYRRMGERVTELGEGLRKTGPR